MILEFIRNLLYRQHRVYLFEYPDSAPRTPGPDPAPGFEVKYFRTLAEVPQAVARSVMPGRVVDLMRWRMRRGHASLLVVFDSKGEMASYCWNQSWKPYRHSFVQVPENGRMVGFGWVNPEHRGRKLFTFMCRRTVAFVDPAERPYGYAIIDNEPSRRAFLAAGYDHAGEFNIRRVLWFFSFSKRVDSHALPFSP